MNYETSPILVFDVRKPGDFLIPCLCFLFRRIRTWGHNKRTIYKGFARDVFLVINNTQKNSLDLWYKSSLIHFLHCHNYQTVVWSKIMNRYQQPSRSLRYSSDYKCEDFDCWDALTCRAQLFQAFRSSFQITQLQKHSIKVLDRVCIVFLKKCKWIDMK